MTRGLVLGALLSVLLFLAVEACTPAQRAAAVPAVTDATCVLLHGFVSSGTVDTICATAEDLAPFLADMLAQREAELPQRGPMLAVAVAELPAPKKRAPPRRRCASWVPVASSVDDASAAGDGEAGSRDSAAAR